MGCTKADNAERGQAPALTPGKGVSQPTAFPHSTSPAGPITRISLLKTTKCDITSHTLHPCHQRGPRPLLPGSAMSMLELKSSERLTCPYHLRRLARNSTATSTKPSLLSSSLDEMLSLALTPQIQRSMALSLRLRRRRSMLVGPWDHVTSGHEAARP